MTVDKDHLHRLPRLEINESGRKRFYVRRFATPEELFSACFDYFEWCNENPIIEQKPMSVSMGSGMGTEIVLTDVPHRRMYTEAGLCMHIGIGSMTWWHWKTPEAPRYWEEAQDVIDWALMTIRDQNITLASLGLLNPVLIMRVLGIKEQMEIDSRTKIIQQSEDSIKPELLSKDERLLLYKALKKQREAEKDELLT